MGTGYHGRVTPGPEAPSFTVSREAGRLSVNIRRRRALPAAAFLAVWLGGWALGETFAARTLLGWSLATGPAEDGSVVAPIFVGVWLLLWTVGGVAAFRALLSSLGGRETVTVEGRSLSLRRSLGPLRWTSRHDLAEVTSLRAWSPSPGGVRTGLGQRLWGPAGRLAFDWHGRTVRFGDGLRDDEVPAVLRALQERTPAAPRRELGGIRPGG